MADFTNATVIGNAQKINDECASTGTRYNPSLARLKLTFLQGKVDEAKAAEVDAVTKLGVFDPFRKARKMVFDPIDATCFGAKGIFNGSGTTKADQNRLMGLYRSLCGIRKVPKKNPPVPEDHHYISVSQQEFDSKVENFLAIIVLLENNSLYDPNEVEYKTATLRATYDDAVLKNAAAKLASGPYERAIELRDNLLYADGTGLCDVYNHEVKEYCKGVMTNDFRPVYLRIKKIILKKRKLKNV
jgi:hypothetical protein